MSNYIWTWSTCFQKYRLAQMIYVDSIKIKEKWFT